MKRHSAEFIRYLLNGLAATAMHYSVLSINIHLLDFSSAGLANFTAAIFGVSASFIGSRYFVFPGGGGSCLDQAMRFALLYAAIALVHGLLLLLWTDIYGFDYRTGFVMAMVLQLSLSYPGNKFLVFPR